MRQKNKTIQIKKIINFIKSALSHISYILNRYRFYLYTLLPSLLSKSKIIPSKNDKLFKVLYVDTINELQAKTNIDGVIKAYSKISTLEVFDYRKLASQYNQFQMNKMLIRAAISFKPDLIHLGKSELIYGLTIKKIKQKINTCVVHFYGDFRWEVQPWVVDIGKYADYTLLYHKESFLIEQYKKLGIKNIGFWWVGADPDVFYPRGGDKIYDVVFMANNSDFLEYEEVSTGLSSQVCSYGYKDIDDNGKYVWVPKNLGN